MMGEMDTALPDRIMKRVIKNLLKEKGQDMSTQDYVEFIKTVDSIAFLAGYRTIELC